MARPTIFTHPKFFKLRALLALSIPAALGYLECLWHVGYERGDPYVGDAHAVEIAVHWEGDGGRMADAFAQSGFIDDNGDGTYSIHDLHEHAPEYVKKRRLRETERKSKKAPVKRRRTTAAVVRRSAPNGKPPAPAPAPAPAPIKEESAPRRFSPPSEEAVREYCAQRKNHVDPQAFVDFYASKGWKVGSAPMKDWRACVRTWETRHRYDGPHGREPPHVNGNIPSEEETRAETERMRREAVGRRGEPAGCVRTG